MFLQIHPVFPSKTGHIRLGHLPPKDRALKKVAEEQKRVLYPNAFLCFLWLAVVTRTLFSWGLCQVLAPAAAWYLTLWVRSGWPNGAPLAFVGQVTQPKTLTARFYHFLVILKWSFFLYMSSDFITCWSFPLCLSSFLSPQLPVCNVLLCLPSPGEGQIRWNCLSMVWGHLHLHLKY